MNPPIIAVSSPPGPSLRGIVRVSAPDLREFDESAVDVDPRDRELMRCRVRVPHPRRSAAGCADSLPALALYCRAPHTFTGEDTLEIQLPGNPALLERIVGSLLKSLRTIDARARLAEPGEFARRAFAAGRIDLTKAEGIAATIGATCDAQLRAAAQLRTGALGRWSTTLVDELAQTLALVEAGIDFVDQDDVVAITPAALDDRLIAVDAELAGLLGRCRSWSSLEALPWVVLVGPPNAGKSTLLNALLGRTRAVTSDAAGTTRDVIAEPLALPDGGEVMLVDIAGLDAAAAVLDRSMQRAAQDAISRADLVLRLIPPPSESRSAHRTELPSHIPAIDVNTKSDIHSSDATLAVSAVTREGLDALLRAIDTAMHDRAVSLGAEMFALRPRHRAELDAAVAAIADARAMVSPQRDASTLAEMELIAAYLRAALDALGALGGAMTPDDVIGKVFATFCVGK